MRSAPGTRLGPYEILDILPGTLTRGKAKERVLRAASCPKCSQRVGCQVLTRVFAAMDRLSGQRYRAQRDLCAVVSVRTWQVANLDNWRRVCAFRCLAVEIDLFSLRFHSIQRTTAVF